MKTVTELYGYLEPIGSISSSLCNVFLDGEELVLYEVTVCTSNNIFRPFVCNIAALGQTKNAI